MAPYQAGHLITGIMEGLKGLDFKTILGRKQSGDYLQTSYGEAVGEMANRLTRKVIVNEGLDQTQTYALITYGLLIVLICMVLAFILYKQCSGKKAEDHHQGHTAITSQRQMIHYNEGKMFSGSEKKNNVETSNHKPTAKDILTN